LQLGWRASEVVKWNGRSMREVNQYVGLKRTVSRKVTHREMIQQQNKHTRARSFFAATGR